MKSYQVTEFGKPLEFRAYDIPTPKDEELLVRIMACGVCHSDLHLADGFFDLGNGKRITLADRGTKLPFTPGHEITGEVISVGKDVTNTSIGDKGIVFPWIGCQKCLACKNQNETLCENPKFLGARLNGGYSTHIIVPHERYLVPYGKLNPFQAAPYACSGLTAYSALKKIPKTTSDEFIVIIGAGGVGTNGILLSPHIHDAQIIVVDNDSSKRDLAKTNGAKYCFSPEEILEKSSLFNSKISGIIDFVGNENTSNLALTIIKKGGTFVIVGLYGGSLSISLPLIPMRSINIRGSYVGELRELIELVELINSKNVRLLNVTKQKLNSANDAMNKLRNGEVDGRIVLEP
ncbi:MAG: zinc-binding dehydrogenase [SAR116 cluster bacterium]|jgi:D-arabinose 1-dehydrogenase-like Zn-dependent alcohol dehydrogenase|nr:zinc-binding dehydrogenase [SAR116 cluster bacterium]|tara:strand:- start:405 stop:1448 length:1044 start_codon:yes stop_codon:yes gene_type:complete